MPLPSKSPYLYHLSDSHWYPITEVIFNGFEHYPKRFEREQNARRKYLDTVNGFDSEGIDIRDLMAGRVDLNDPRVNGLWAE